MLQLRKIWILHKGLLCQKKVKENANLVEEDKIIDEGIIMMANECITLDSDMV